MQVILSHWKKEKYTKADGRVEGVFVPEFLFFHDWDSFIFWKPMKWRDFTLINISYETGPNRWYEIHVAVLGFHFWSQWLRQIELDE